MQATRNQRCVSSSPRHATPRWLGACLLAALLTACGGSDYDSTVAPPGGPVPATVSFKLLPARVGLTTGGASKLLALQSPGALTWSSSDPAVASVDSEGLVTALAAGSAVISASSATSVASASVTVFASSAATRSALIASALAQNRISAEQALMYRVFAMFGDPRLPAEFAGAPDGAPDHQLLRQVSGALPTLSQPARDALVPFLLPPIYAESWFAQQLGLPAASVASQKAQPAAAKDKRPGAITSVNCEAATLTRFWRTLTTAHFNIHYIQLGSDEFYDAYHRKGAETIAAVVEEVYAAETGLLGRFPLADTNEACNGGDGALDIYLTSLGSSDTRGATTTYPDRCNKVPSFIAINAGDPAIAAASSGIGDARRETKAIVAHEFAHVLQFAMDRAGNAFGCDEYEWLDEATAEWAMDFVDATWNREDGANPTNGNYRRSGSFYSQYLYSDHMNSIEKPGLAGDPKKNGYADYIFFQYLARKYDPQTIKLVFDETTARRSVEAVEAALASKGGMKAVWPEFALTLWNDAANQNLDDFSRWDGYDFGLAPVFERRAGVPPAHPEAGKLKTIDVNQRGQGRESFKMLQNALDRPGGSTASDFYEIQPRSIFFEHLKFSDPTVSSVYFFNPVAVIPGHGFIKVQARKKIGGTWRDTEDWTDEPYKQFCRDKQDERLEELLIVISNSQVDRANETPFRFPKLVPMQTSSSNVGCWKWVGRASSVVTGTVPGPSESTARGNVTFEVASMLPGRLRFETSIGNVGGDSRATLGACTLTSVGAPRAAGRLPLPDGTIDFNLDLDLGFGQIGGQAPDRKLITLASSSTLSTTNTLVCPTGTQTSVFDTTWDWLHVDKPELYPVSADGRTIEGRFTSNLPGGGSINTVWKFTAQRE